MSPEMDLLDQLLGSDESLYFALRVFGRPEDAEGLEHARRAVTEQVKEGFVCVKHKVAAGERVLPEWEARRVLAEGANWLKRGGDAEYYLSLTERGTSYVG